MPIIHGKRIRLRAAEKKDIPTFLRWINDEEVTEFLSLFSPISHHEEEGWFETMMEKPASEHILVIEIKNQEEPNRFTPIGSINFHNIDWRNRSAEVGIMIGEKALWDKGYGTETMRLMIDHGFNTLNLHRIWLRVFEKNQRGIRTYQKAGFQYEGKYRQAEFRHGEYQDVHLMSILTDEWQKIKTSK